MYCYGAGLEYNKREDLIIGAGVDVVWEGDLPVKEAGNAIAGTVEVNTPTPISWFATVYASWKF
jgi:hypothetical protein